MKITICRNLLGLLLAFAPAAISAQTPQGVKVVRARMDTVVTTRIDTAIVVHYDTLPDPEVVPATVPAVSPAGNLPLDSIIARAVRLGVQQALRDMQKPEEEDTVRTPVERIWDRSQKKRRIERISREGMKATFVPKGQWMLGGTFNFQEWDADNINMLVLKDINIKGHLFGVTPMFGYFVANNIAVGGRYSYNRQYFNLGNFDLNLGEDFNISLKDLYYLQHTHTLSAFVRTYMPLGKSKVYGFFSEIRGSYAHHVGKNTTGSGAEYDGSYEKGNSIQLTFCPGMTVFVTDFLAVETSIGVMGLKYSWKKQTTNRVEEGKSKSGGANFKFNLFSVDIGLIFYL